MRTFFPFLVLALACSPVRALDPARLPSQYLARTWTADQGLVSSSVMRVRQTPDGYLWIATDSGLSRFDGIRFINFMAGSTPGFPSGTVRWLLPARDGSLWIAADGGVAQYREGRWRTYGDQDGLPGNRADSLAEGKATIWAATVNGVRYWKDGRFQRPDWDSRLPDSYVHQLIEDPAGDLWIATKRGLAHVHQGNLRVFTTKDGLRDDDVSAVFRDRQGTIWYGTHRAGLGRWREGRLEQLPLDTWLKTRENPAVHSFAEDAEGNLWIAVYYGGLVRLHADQPALYTVKEGLSGDEAYDVTFDREGNLWAAVARGGGLLQLRDSKFLNYGLTEGTSPGTSAVTQTADGTIWAGTPDRGLMRLGPLGLSAENVPAELRVGRVTGLLGGRDGSLWVGFWGSRIARLADGRVTFYSLPASQANSTNALYQDRDGTVWIGYVAGGVARIRDSMPSPVLLPDLVRVTVRRFLQARNGDLWMASPSHGLIRLHDGRVTMLPELAGTYPSWLHEDSDGALWVTTAGQGLYCLWNGRTYRWTRQSGLPDSLLQSIFETKRGEFWLQGYSGVVRVRRSDLFAQANGTQASLPVDVFGKADGLNLRETGLAQAYQDRAGRLWFPTLRGVSLADPLRTARNTLPPAVQIEEMTFDDRATSPKDGQAVGPGHGSLTFQYTGLSLTAPEKNLFRYKLEGLDVDWVEAGGRRTAYYTNVPHGSYRFRVQASNNDGVWNEAQFAFEIRPWFYQTVWFRLVAGSLATVAILGAAWALLLMRTRNLWKAKQWLEAEVARQTSELVSAKEAAERAARLKSEFLANMSHEIRTPMHGILGMTDLALAAETNPSQTERLDVIKSSANSLLSILNDILDLSKMDAGKLEIKPAPCRAADLLRDAHRTLLAAAREKAIDLQWQVAPQVPEYVECDASRVRQVLLNLIGNAIKFTPQGSVRVELSSQEVAGGGIELRFSVSDTGIGIPREYQQAIFEAFRQVDGSASRNFSGTGLGLSISSRLVGLMGGRITVESEPGAGSTFRFTVQARPAANPAKGAVSAAHTGSRPAVQPLSILVAEDNVVNQSVARSLLQKRGHRVTVVGDGELALDRSAVENFDLILMDVQMPKMDGWEATRRIRRREAEAGRHTRIVALTAHALQEAREQCMEAGMDDVLLKPFESASLYSVVEGDGEPTLH